MYIIVIIGFQHQIGVKATPEQVPFEIRFCSATFCLRVVLSLSIEFSLSLISESSVVFLTNLFQVFEVINIPRAFVMASLFVFSTSQLDHRDFPNHLGVFFSTLVQSGV